MPHEDNIIVSYLLCLTGAGAYPGAAGGRITKAVKWYGRVLNVCFYLAIVGLNIIHAVSLNFNLGISKYVLVVITCLLANLLIANNLQIPTRQADFKKGFNIIKEVNEQLQNTSKNVRNKYLRHCVTVYIVCEFVLCVKYAIFVALYRQTGCLTYVAPIHFAQQYIQMLIIIQFVTFIKHIQDGFSTVNKRLKDIYNSHFDRPVLSTPKPGSKRRHIVIQVRSKALGTPSNHGSRTKHKLRKVALSYLQLCQLVYLTNDKNGTCLLWATVYMTINVIMSMYNLLLEITNVDIKHTALVLPTLWLIFTTTRLVLLTEQCHRIHEEMANTKYYVARLKCSFGDTHVPVANELELFQRLLALNRPTFSPQDMFTLTRTFTTKVVGAVITMLVILVTYGKEVKGQANPSGSK